MDNIKLMVVDDQQLVRMGLVSLLRDIPGLQVLAEAESGEQALDQVVQLMREEQAPDIILMDLRMPGMGGLEATRVLAHRYPAIKVIAITACAETPFPQRFLDSGALGFLTKDADINEVIKAIRTVYRGKRYISHGIAQELAIYAVNHSLEASPFESLSHRELQIALMVMDSVKTTQIAQLLHVSPKTVNTYRYRLFEKLNIQNNMELAMLASRHGLLKTHDSRS